MVRRLDLTGQTQSYFFVEEVGNPANSRMLPIGSNYPNTVIDGVMLHTSGSQGADCYIDELIITGVLAD